MSNPNGDPNPNLIIPKVDRLPARALIEQVGHSQRLIMTQLAHDFELPHGKEFSARNLRSIKVNQIGVLTDKLTRLFPLIERHVLGEKPEENPTGQAVVRIASVGLNGVINQVALEKIHEGMGNIGRLRQAGKLTPEAAATHKEVLRRRRDIARQSVIESNNMFRDIASGTHMTRRTLNALLQAYALSDDEGRAHGLEVGIAGEVATHKAIQAAIERLQANGDTTERSVRFGQAQEDSKGGDLVYTVGNTVVYVDAKISNLGQAAAQEDMTAGYSLGRPRKASDNYDLKLTIWPSGRDSLNEDMTYDDPAFTAELEAALAEIDSRANN